jgi:hypothetical protein
MDWRLFTSRRNGHWPIKLSGFFFFLARIPRDKTSMGSMRFLARVPADSGSPRLKYAPTPTGGFPNRQRYHGTGMARRLHAHPPPSGASMLYGELAKPIPTRFKIPTRKGSTLFGMRAKADTRAALITFRKLA